MTASPEAFPPTASPITSIAVVIPARNEEQRLAACLRSVERAVRYLGAGHPQVSVRVVVVLDRCTDGTSEIALRHGVECVISDHGLVGAARAEGVARVLDGAADPARVWIACTDADSRVPVEWLRHHLALADRSADLVLGTVRPDRAELSARMAAAWHARHVLTDGHPHIHGANMGIRGSAYLAAGGFEPVAVHEDVLIATEIRDAGGHVMSTAGCPVITSARRVGRTPAGMAGYLQVLAGSPDVAATGE